MSESTRLAIAPPRCSRLLKLGDDSVGRAFERLEAVLRAGPVTSLDELPAHGRHAARSPESYDLDAALEPDRRHPPRFLTAGGHRHLWIRR